jgi:anti-sigma B factor antagonist
MIIEQTAAAVRIKRPQRLGKGGGIVNNPVPSLRIGGNPHDQVIYLTGELDLATTPQLQSAVQQVIDADEHSITLDLTGLTFCDSTGLGLFVAINHQLRGGLVLRNPAPQVQKLLRTTGLNDAFHL